MLWYLLSAGFGLLLSCFDLEEAFVIPLGGFCTAPTLICIVPTLYLHCTYTVPTQTGACCEETGIYKMKKKMFATTGSLSKICKIKDNTRFSTTNGSGKDWIWFHLLSYLFCLNQKLYMTNVGVLIRMNITVFTHVCICVRFHLFCISVDLPLVPLDLPLVLPLVLP